MVLDTMHMFHHRPVFIIWAVYFSYGSLVVVWWKHLFMSHYSGPRDRSYDASVGLPLMDIHLRVYHPLRFLMMRLCSHGHSSKG